MGYRSNVALLLYGTPEKVDIVDALLLQKLDDVHDRDMFEATKQVHDEQISYGEVTALRRSILWQFNDIKWDSQMDAYKTHVFDWVYDINEETPDHEKSWSLNVEFVRTGENLEDIEEAYSENSDYRLYISREIVVPNIFE